MKWRRTRSNACGGCAIIPGTTGATGTSGAGGDISLAFGDDISIKNGVLVLRGTVAAEAGASSVEVFEGDQDLGAAHVDAAKGTWALALREPAGLQIGFRAVATDSGGTAVAGTNFDVTTGVRGQPYAAVEDLSDPDTGAFLGQTFFNRDGSVYERSAYADPGNGFVTYTDSGGSLFAGGSTVSTVATFRPDGTQVAFEENGRDGSHSVDVTGTGLSLASEGSSTFVFEPSHGQDTITGFTLGGANHDTLDLPTSEFTSMAEVLRNTQNTAAGAAITDPTTGDTVTLAGVSKAELTQHRQDFKFHA